MESLEIRSQQITLRSEIFRIYDGEKARMMPILNANKSRIAATIICGLFQTKRGASFL